MTTSATRAFAAAAPSAAYELLSAKEAALFYEEACRRDGLHIHSTFLKQLLLGSVVIQFEDGYLGDSGIAPIVLTLQRVPLRALLLSRCALSSEDVKLLCAGLTTHPQLEKIDVRGVALTIGGVKELLHLVTRNTRITEVLMDEGLPKFVAIQQQCQRNAQSSTSAMSACVMCGAAVTLEARASCETLVLRFLVEHLKPHSRSISAAGLTVLGGGLQQCVDRNDGVLTVCGEVCGEALAEDLCSCVWSIPKALIWQVPYDFPKAPFLRTYLAHELERWRGTVAALLEKKDGAEGSLSTAMPPLSALLKSPTSATDVPLSKTFFLPGPVDEQAEACWRTKKPRGDIDEFFDNRADRDVTRCTVCGQPGVCSTDGATWLLRTLQLDVEEHGISVTPAALLRLCRMFTAHARVRPCSRRCLRHLVRYALYGYGGVNCSYVGGFPPLTSVVGGAAELLRLPLVDFTVVDVARETVHDVASEEINCALTVASALSDTDGVAMDPYLIFSIGRQLRKMSLGSIGMDLASACEAVRLVGCLPEAEAPYKRFDSAGAPRGGDDEEDGDNDGVADAPRAAAPRNLVADWPSWSAASGEATVRRWLHSAFARRRQRVCAIDGPHRDLFDNIRAALWTLRQQSRCVLVTMKVAMSWLSLKDGVVPSTTSTHTHGFCTTAKVVGQSVRDNTVYLILQCPLGRHVGYNGFLYLPKTVFLQGVRGLAFVFADAVGLEHREAGWRASFYSKEVVGPSLGVSGARVQLLRQLVISLVASTSGRQRREGPGWCLVGSRVRADPLRALFERDCLPAGLAFLREALGLSALPNAIAATSGRETETYCARDVHRTYGERVLLSSRYPSQLLFFFHEILGDGQWLQRALATAEAALRANRAPSPADAAAAPNSMAQKADAAVVSERLEASGAGEERVWQTLGSVPELGSLTKDFPAAVTIVEAEESVTPAKAPRRRGSTKAMADVDKTASRAPKPPTSPAPAQSAALVSRRRVSNSVSAAEDASVATTPMHALPLVKPIHVTEKGEGRSANVAVSVIGNAGPGRGNGGNGNTVQDKMQLRLQKGWKAERLARNALLHDAARVGIVEFLRTRTQAARVRLPTMSQEPPCECEQCAGGADDRHGAPSQRSAGGRSGSGGAAAEAREIPARLLNKPWFVIPVQSDSEKEGDGVAAAKSRSESRSSYPDLHLLFIGDSVAVYSMQERRLLCYPSALGGDALTASFPFASGVDAATLHPVHPHLVFFFSGREWLLFDLQLLECVDGPYPLSVHGQFRKLPAAFHDGVDSVLAVPDTSLLVFFRGLSYVLFDVTARRCVGGIGVLIHPTQSRNTVIDARARGSAAALRSTNASSSSPTSAVAESLRGASSRSGAGGRATVTNNGRKDDGNMKDNASSLSVEPQLQAVLGVAPMTAFTTAPLAAGEADTHWLVSRTGRVVKVQWELQREVSAMEAAAASNTLPYNEAAMGETITTTGTSTTTGAATPRWVLRCCPDVDASSSASASASASSALSTPLEQLPVVFRQTSPSALHALCALAVQTDFTLEVQQTKDGAALPSSSLQLFNPEGSLRDLLSITSPGVSPVKSALPPLTATQQQRTSSLSTTAGSLEPGKPQASMKASTTAGTTTTAYVATGKAMSAAPPTTTITSSLTPTVLAEQNPLALSRCGPVGGSALDDPGVGSHRHHSEEPEVFFYGDGAVVASPQHTNPQSAAFPGSRDVSHDRQSTVLTAGNNAKPPTNSSTTSGQWYIEYDLGSAAPRRSFSALLLLLDTALLPSAVLQLAPLRASVESSAEGEVYTAVASLRIAGPVTAAKWADGALCIEPGAARFWRLRFHSAVPAVVGVVRLLWFETPSGAPSQTIAGVPLSTCTTLPLRMLPPQHVSTSQRGGIGGGGGRAEVAASVGVEALSVMASPELLLNTDNVQPVFMINPSPQARGWYGQHNAFPLFGQHTSLCLLCCGASFLEVHVANGDDSAIVDAPVASSSQTFADHVRFSELPYPFVLGWDATFYPSPQERPGLMCLIRSDGLLLWDSDANEAQGDIVLWRRSALLEGLQKVPIAHIVATMNCFEHADRCVVAFVYEEASSTAGAAELQYLEYDVVRRTVMHGPVPFASHLRTRYGASLPSTESGHELLSVLRTPAAPSQLYLFYQNRVQVATLRSPGEVATASVHADALNTTLVPLTESHLFYRVPLLLPKWGTRQRHCRIVMDMGVLLRTSMLGSDAIEEDDGVLVTGMQLISSGGKEGSAARWQVQCSEHGRIWRDVAVHQQKSGERVIGETSWVAEVAGRYTAARFWRFLRLSSTENEHGGTERLVDRETCLQSYSQLRLLTVPRKRLTLVPVRISGGHASSAAVEVCNAFFSKGTRDAALSLSLRAFGDGSAGRGEGAYELVWDYGLSIVALCSVAFTVENTPANVLLTWTISGGTDASGEHWRPMTTGTTTTTSEKTRCSLTWMPEGPYRYWRLLCVATPIDHPSGACPPALKLSALRVYEYVGPLVSMQGATGDHRNATSCLWPSPEEKAAPIALHGTQYNTIQFSRVVAPLTSCTVDFYVTGNCTACVSMEWSADATQWYTVALVTFSTAAATRTKMERVVLSWRSCGPRRLWRTRVLDTSSDVTFLPVRLHLGTAPADPRMKLSSPELLQDAATVSASSTAVATMVAGGGGGALFASPASAATPSPSRRGSWQATDKAFSMGNSVSTAAGMDDDESTATTGLTLGSPQRLVGVRATLPAASSRYAVEYLGLDGASWISAAVLEGGADGRRDRARVLSDSAAAATTVSTQVAGGAAASSVWWDGATVSPSAQWRLRPLPLESSGDDPFFSSSPLSMSPSQQKARAVEWFADIGSCVESVNTSVVPGVLVSTVGFTEVQPPHLLSGGGKGGAPTQRRPAMQGVPVLQCTATPTRARSSSTAGSSSSLFTATATWSFISPLHLDQLTLHFRATPKAPKSSDGAADDDDGVPLPPTSATCEAAVQNIWVETSDNGDDFVAIAHALWWPRDTTVVLTWEEVPPATFWRLRLSNVSAAPASASSSAGASGQRSRPYTLDIFAAVWGVRRSGPALIATVGGAPPGSFTNTSYRAWLTDRYNNEATFMRDCQNGFDEVRSTESKLRAADDLSALGRMAQAVQKLRSRYQTFIQKTTKEAARMIRAKEEAEEKAAAAAAAADGGAEGASGAKDASDAHPTLASSPHHAHAHWLTPARASTDVMLLLLESASNPTLGGEKMMQLAELVDQPLALREAYKFTKKPARWFYPCLEVVGQAADEWYGFAADNVCAALCVYWSLSTALQRRRDALLSSDDLILPLSEHVASPLVVVHVNELNWSPHQHFPSVPFLYAVGFHEQPVTVVFALNDVVFSPPYALSIPAARDSQALTSTLPYTVYAGVNFLQARSLGSCPAPIFDVLRYILPAAVFNVVAEEKPKKAAAGKRRSHNDNSSDGLVLMVLTTSGPLQQGGGGTAVASTTNAPPLSAQLRFTVPADGVDLGLAGLVMDSLEFEIAMTAEGPNHKTWTYQTTFVSHNARFVSQATSSGGKGGVSTEVPVSLLGNVDMRGLPVIALRGSLGNERVANVADIPGAVVTDIRFHAIAQVESLGAASRASVVSDGSVAAAAAAPTRWVCSPLQCEAQVVLPGMTSTCTCACVLSASEERGGALQVTELQIALQRSALGDVQSFCRACSGKSSRGRSAAASATVVNVANAAAASADLCGLNVQLAALMAVSASPPDAAGRRGVTLRGQGLLYMDNDVLQSVEVSMSTDTQVVTVTATCPHRLHVGAIDIHGSEEVPITLQLILSDAAAASSTSSAFTGGVSADAVSAASSSSSATLQRLLIAGDVYVFGTQQPARATLELTRNAESGDLATLAVHSICHTELRATVQDSVVSSSWRYAQVTVDEALLRSAVAREVGDAPIVAALRAHGIPLNCVVSSVSAAPYDMVAQRLSLRVRGMLFGSSFDVMTYIVCPDDVEEAWDVVAAHVCPQIVEQCEENLWASYANVVGCRVLDSNQESEA